jgi:hypothetical protein
MSLTWINIYICRPLASGMSSSTRGNSPSQVALSTSGHPLLPTDGEGTLLEPEDIVNLGNISSQSLNVFLIDQRPPTVRHGAADSQSPFVRHPSVNALTQDKHDVEYISDAKSVPSGKSSILGLGDRHRDCSYKVET